MDHGEETSVADGEDDKTGHICKRPEAEAPGSGETHSPTWDFKLDVTRKCTESLREASKA